MIGRLLRWGNSYGVRLSKGDVEELGLKEGSDVAFDVKNVPGKKIDLTGIPSADLGGDLSVRHDEVDWSVPRRRQ